MSNHRMRASVSQRKYEADTAAYNKRKAASDKRTGYVDTTGDVSVKAKQLGANALPDKPEARPLPSVETKPTVENKPYRKAGDINRALKKNLEDKDKMAGFGN